jgi:hypothetical protein
MVYVKVPREKVAHIIKGEYPKDHTTCCGLLAIVHDKYLHTSYNGKVCETCKKFSDESK